MAGSVRWAGIVVVAAAGVVVAGCRGAGPYGHAAVYTPTDDETKALAGAREYDPVMAARSPAEWAKQDVSLFGVVTSRAAGSGGAAYLTLALRRLQPRNLCKAREDEDTCRVTVSETDFGVVHALVPLRDADDTGALSVRPVSLLRIVGRVAGEVDATDGAPVVRARFYRHWPPGTYVTMASAGELRQ